MTSLQLNVPALRLDRRGDVLVTRWGEVGGFTFRAGDRVIVGDEVPGSLVLLRPRGYGWPMLGRRQGRRLVAEPGGVPAAEMRWRVAGGVVAVERDLERAVTDGGTWHVVVRIRSRSDRESVALEALEPGVRARFADGQLSAGQLEALCLRAALAPEQFGLEFAIGAAQDAVVAESLAQSAGFGAIALDIRGGVSESAGGRLIIGPWTESVAPVPASAAGGGRQAVQLGLFGAAGAGAGGAGASSLEPEPARVPSLRRRSS